MLEIKTTEEQREAAMILAEPMMKQYRGNAKSIRRGKGIYIAKLGEMIVSETLGFKYIDTYNADTEALLVNGENRKVEVKVKERTVPPRGSYNASVACYNTKQACDYYLFCSTLRDEFVYILGIIPKEEFLQKAIFGKEGELDPDGPPGQNWRFKADCYNMQYKLMRQIGKTPLPD